MASKTKIFVIYHLNETPIVSDVYQPICVGPNKDAFPSSFLRDDKGDNIADKNSYYNEMTAVYWVYKHIDEFKDIDYIGFSHYRRLFCFSHLNKSVYVKKNLNNEYIEIDNERLDRIFKDYDLITPYPNHYKSVRRHYEKSHNKIDIDIITHLIKQHKPEYYKTANDYFLNEYEYSYNMFIFKKDDFIKYGDFVFTILEAFEKEKENIDRLYISERLTGIFISYLIEKGEIPLKLPILHIRKKSFKKSAKEVGDNFKKGTDRGFLYKSKSLLLYLMPRCFEQYLRRRKS